MIESDRGDQHRIRVLESGRVHTILKNYPNLHIYPKIKKLHRARKFKTDLFLSNYFGLRLILKAAENYAFPQEKNFSFVEDNKRSTNDNQDRC